MHRYVCIHTKDSIRVPTILWQVYFPKKILQLTRCDWFFFWFFIIFLYAVNNDTLIDWIYSVVAHHCRQCCTPSAVSINCVPSGMILLYAVFVHGVLVCLYVCMLYRVSLLLHVVMFIPTTSGSIVKFVIVCSPVIYSLYSYTVEWLFVHISILYSSVQLMYN